METEYILQHASILLGKSVNDIWRLNLKQNLVVHDFMKQYCLPRKGNKNTDNSQVQKINNVLQASARASTDLENASALVLSIFPLVTLYLKEQCDFLYKIVDLRYFTDDEVNEFVENPSPVLLIKGQSLFDPTATCAVIIEKKVCFTPKDILEGILITFLAYYIFGLSYPGELSKTLEFIQRVLLDINPATKGSKLKKGGKRSACTYSPVVKTLYDKLRQFAEILK